MVNEVHTELCRHRFKENLSKESFVCISEKKPHSWSLPTSAAGHLFWFVRREWQKKQSPLWKNCKPHALLFKYLWTCFSLSPVQTNDIPDPETIYALSNMHDGMRSPNFHTIEIDRTQLNSFGSQDQLRDRNISASLNAFNQPYGPAEAVRSK